MTVAIATSNLAARFRKDYPVLPGTVGQGITMKIAVAITLGLFVSPLSLAASAPPTTQIFGTVLTANSAGTKGYYCSAAEGLSLFQRLGASAANPNPPAMLGISGIAYYNPTTGVGTISTDGVLLLDFKTPSSGTIRIDLDKTSTKPKLPSGETIPFNSYSQVWTPNASTLRVSFTIVFPNCRASLEGLFRAAP